MTNTSYGVEPPHLSRILQRLVFRPFSENANYRIEAISRVLTDVFRDWERLTPTLNNPIFRIVALLPRLALPLKHRLKVLSRITSATEATFSSVPCATTSSPRTPPQTST